MTLRLITAVTCLACVHHAHAACEDMLGDLSSAYKDQNEALEAVDTKGCTEVPAWREAQKSLLDVHEKYLAAGCLGPAMLSEHKAEAAEVTTQVEESCKPQ